MSWPPGQIRPVRSVCDLQVLGEGDVGVLERVLVALVDPDRELREGAVGTGAGGDDVMGLEVLGVVEGAGGAEAAVGPERRRVAADGAEVLPGCEPGEVEAPKPPIEMPPIAIRSGSVPKRSSTAGITSSVT